MCLALGEVQRGAGGPTPVDQEERAGHGNNGEVTPEGKEEGRELSGPPPGVPGTPLPCSLGVLAPHPASYLRATYTVTEVRDGPLTPIFIGVSPQRL